MPRLKDANAKKQSYFMWLDLPEDQRFPATRAAKAAELGVQYATVNGWEKKEYPEWKKRQVAPVLVDITNLSDEDKVKQFDALLYKLAIDPNRPAKERELFARRLGLLIDKSEHKVTIGLDASELLRIEQQARQRNSSEGYALREGEVQGEHPLLPYKIREDTG